MDAIITAGGSPNPGDLLYSYTGGKPKALLDIADKPMIQWVLDAVGSVDEINQVVIVGIDEMSGVHCRKPLFFVRDHGAMLDNIRAGVIEAERQNPAIEQVVLLSSDIPAVTKEMVEWVFGNISITDEDIYYCVVSRQVMETRFPESRRTYIRFKDIELCGGDIVVLRAEVASGKEAIWERLIASRKNILRQAALIGYDTLLKLLLRRLTLNDAVETISNRLGVRGKVLISPYAEIGMDVDKPYQYKLLQKYLFGRHNYGS
jgi:molybdopterin-guanine dinucleotide biosynthesis protein A